ncbi:DUF2971 domain-containing protein [Marinomonas arenicola]|uniref:DUF2971 domain-containing protein n=1 Tax=Marinomonas arenicola TaxID=569601 RepID=A0ABU9G4F2_9GAMM
MKQESLRDFVTNEFESILDKELNKLKLDPFKRAIHKAKAMTEVEAYLKSLNAISQSSAITAPLESAFSVLNELIGIACFSEDGESRHMWKKYSENNKGFMLEFDTSHDFFDSRVSDSDSLRILTPMNYSSERPKDFLAELNEKTICYTKTADWAIEREHRLIRRLSDLREVYKDIYVDDFPFSALKSFTFGSECSDETVKRYLPLIENESPNIKTYRIRENREDNSFLKESCITLNTL